MAKMGSDRLGDTLARPYQPDDERPTTLGFSGPEQRDRVRDLNRIDACAISQERPSGIGWPGFARR